MPPRQQQEQDGQKPSGMVFEQFAGMNTAMVRAGVPDEQAYWLDGMMPVTPRQLRVLWGLGDALYIKSTIVMFGAYNIGPDPFLVVFLADGAVDQVSTVDGTVTNILPAGSITNPAITTLGFSQWSQKYLLIVSTQPNGYWVWDGTIVFAAGSLAPEGITITDAGSGYQTQPVISFAGGHGSGATAIATIDNGVVTGATITSPGSGYIATDSVSVVFTGGTQAGSGATLAAIMGNESGGSLGQVQVSSWTNIGGGQYIPNGLIINNRGAGYSRVTRLGWNMTTAIGHWNTGPPGLGVSITSGTIAHVSFIPTSTWVVGGGTFPSVSVVDGGVAFVSSVSVVSAGSNYSPSATVNITGGSVSSPATLENGIVGGSIASVSVINGGVYFATTPVPTVSEVDVARDAAGTIGIMAIGISGNAVQTYQGHVWVLDGLTYNFTAPGSVSDFSTANGGGSGQSSDNFLRVGYVAAIQTNGFLFLIGDSSMNYISGVQTTGTPPTTTFTNQNADPEIGTPYPASVTTLGQEIFLANETGIFVSSGGAFVKRSEMLDGVYNTVPNFGGFQLSSAKATIFGKRVWMTLVPIVDPVDGAPLQTTNGNTAAGGNVLHFANVSDRVLEGMFAYDITNPTAIAAGTTVTAADATSVTLSANVAAPGVSSNDSIVFFKTKLFMFNGRAWWASEQDFNLTFIAGQEINSTYRAWGTDGQSIWPLFDKPTTAFVKRAVSKLWDDPGYEMNKTVNRFWSLWHCYSATAVFNLRVDAVGLDENGAQFDEPAVYTGLTIQGDLNTTTATAPLAVGQQGILVGMTISTNDPDIALVSAKILPDVYQYRG